MMLVAAADGEEDAAAITTVVLVINLEVKEEVRDLLGVGLGLTVRKEKKFRLGEGVFFLSKE